MYFKNIPNIQYDNKPIKYPFSDSDYTVAKNFFRRYQVNPEMFSYAVFFSKYAVEEGERLDQIAYKAYDDPFLDWVIVLTNNMMTPGFAMPMSYNELRTYCEKNYDSPYSTIKHYETYEVKNSSGNIVLNKGLIVDSYFKNKPFKYWDNGTVTQVAGNLITRPVTIFEYEEEQNEKNREIYLLKGEYLTSFMDNFKSTILYKKSNNYISQSLKKTN